MLSRVMMRATRRGEPPADSDDGGIATETGVYLSGPAPRRPVAVRSPAPRRRYIAFALVTVALALVACLVVLLAADVYLHRKYERTASVNVWGYRGPTVGPKQPLETRIAVFGGSTAFGYGPDWDGSFPYLMEQRLNAFASLVKERQH